MNFFLLQKLLEFYDLQTGSMKQDKGRRVREVGKALFEEGF